LDPADRCFIAHGFSDIEATTGQFECGAVGGWHGWFGGAEAEGDLIWRELHGHGLIGVGEGGE
jgi:hypothetical protein